MTDHAFLLQAADAYCREVEAVVAKGINAETMAAAGRLSRRGSILAKALSALVSAIAEASPDHPARHFADLLVDAAAAVLAADVILAGADNCTWILMTYQKYRD